MSDIVVDNRRVLCCYLFEFNLLHHARLTPVKTKFVLKERATVIVIITSTAIIPFNGLNYYRYLSPNHCLNYHNCDRSKTLFQKHWIKRLSPFESVVSHFHEDKVKSSTLTIDNPKFLQFFTIILSDTIKEKSCGKIIWQLPLCTTDTTFVVVVAVIVLNSTKAMKNKSSNDKIIQHNPLFFTCFC